MSEEITLRENIMNAEVETVFFRTDFPQYHVESVGRVLSEMTDEGVLMRLSPGVYVKPRMSRFGPVIPSVMKVVEAIARRDNAQILPSGATALNALGLSTQVPVSYSFLTTGSARTLLIGGRKVTLKRGVPKNFAYNTQIIAYLVQALRCLGERNVGADELNQIGLLIHKETDREGLQNDVHIMPEWMKRIVKPMII